jgi:hypothetical protein
VLAVRASFVGLCVYTNICTVIVTQLSCRCDEWRVEQHLRRETHTHTHKGGECMQFTNHLPFKKAMRQKQ